MSYLKTIVTVFFLFAGFSCQKSSSEPEKTDNPAIQFLPAELDLFVDDTASIEIELSDVSESVFGISMQIDYDSELLGFDESSGIEQGTFFENAALVFYQILENRLYLSLTLTRGSSPVNGSGTLCRFSIFSKNTGSGNLEIRQTGTHFYNSDGEEIFFSGLIIDEMAINVE